MSGLTVFFQGFLTNEQDATYSQSVATLRTTEDQEGTNDPTSNVNVELTEPLSFKEWRSLQREVVNEYMQDRMLIRAEERGTAPSEDEGTANQRSGDEASAAKVPASGTEDSQPQFETQQFQEGSDDEGAVGPPLYRTPHMDEALHTVDFLTDIDLHTKEANLKLLEVHRYWYLRKTNRNAAMFVVPRRQPKYTTGLGPPRLPLYPCEDDGPLACLYRSVLSVEVSQLDRPSSSNRARAAAAMHQETSVRRMKLFFYDFYAKSVSRWLAKAQQTSTKLLLQLNKIPSQCIVPQSMISWVDYDTSHCCICLGDDSKMRMEQGAQSSSVRFDSNETEVYAALVNSGTVLKEYKIASKTCHESEEILPENSVIGPIIDAQKIQQVPAIAGHSVDETTPTGMPLQQPPQARPESSREANQNHLLDEPAAESMEVETIDEDQSELKPAARREEQAGERMPETHEEQIVPGAIEMEESEEMSFDPKQAKNADSLHNSANEAENLAAEKEATVEKPATEDELQTNRQAVSAAPSDDNLSIAAHANQDNRQSHLQDQDVESTLQRPAQISEEGAVGESANASDTENETSQPSITDTPAPVTVLVPPVNVDRTLAAATTADGGGKAIPIRIIQDDTGDGEHPRKRKRTTDESTTEYHSMVSILLPFELPMIICLRHSHTQIHRTIYAVCTTVTKLWLSNRA
jgi:hypothetical protein